MEFFNENTLPILDSASKQLCVVMIILSFLSKSHLSKDFCFKSVKQREGKQNVDVPKKGKKKKYNLIIGTNCAELDIWVGWVVGKVSVYLSVRLYLYLSFSLSTYLSVFLFA